jgi:hypothetical protein
MREHILFLTGRLAEASLRKVLASLEPAQFTYDLHVPCLQVAGLMTADMIHRRLPSTQARSVLVPRPLPR